MSELLKSVKDLDPSTQFVVLTLAVILVVALLKALGWVFTEYWAEAKEKQKTHDMALTQNTLAITKLEVQIDRLNEFLHLVPKLQADITMAHQKIRDLEKR